MNRLRIVNYLIKEGLIKEDYDPLDIVQSNLLVTTKELFDKLEPLCTSKFTNLEVISVNNNTCNLNDFIRTLLIKGIKFPLNPDDYTGLTKIKISHDTSLDDLELGYINMPNYCIDWEHSYEEFDVKLNKSGVDKIYSKLPYTKLYDDLTFSIIKI